MLRASLESESPDMRTNYASSSHLFLLRTLSSGDPLLGLATPPVDVDGGCFHLCDTAVTEAQNVFSINDSSLVHNLIMVEEFKGLMIQQLHRPMTDASRVSEKSPTGPWGWVRQKEVLVQALPPAHPRYMYKDG